MTVVKTSIGIIEGPWSEHTNLNPTQYFVPHREKQRPASKYGTRGIHVVMRPIKGLTPNGVFPQNKWFAFQCPPMNEFGEDGTHDFQDYNVIGREQHSQEIGRGLRTVQFQTIFLDWEPVWSVAGDRSGGYPAQAAVQDLCKIRDHGQPFHLTAHQPHRDRYEVDWAATLRSVSWNVPAGEDDAYYVTVQFSEYSTPDIQEFLAEAAVNPRTPTSLAVARLGSNENTLAKLAKLYYGDPARWRVIASANGLNVAPNVELTKKRVRSTQIAIPQLRKQSGSKARRG